MCPERPRGPLEGRHARRVDDRRRSAWRTDHLHSASVAWLSRLVRRKGRCPRGRKQIGTDCGDAVRAWEPAHLGAGVKFGGAMFFDRSAAMAECPASEAAKERIACNKTRDF